MTRNFIRHSGRLAGFAGAVTIAGLLLAANAEACEGRGGRRGPPPEAIEACAEVALEDVCSFVSPRGDEVAGTCLERREEVVCVPEGRRRARHGGGRPDEGPEE